MAVSLVASTTKCRLSGIQKPQFELSFYHSFAAFLGEPFLIDLKCLPLSICGVASASQKHWDISVQQVSCGPACHSFCMILHLQRQDWSPQCHPRTQQSQMLPRLAHGFSLAWQPFYPGVAQNEGPTGSHCLFSTTWVAILESQPSLCMAS